MGSICVWFTSFYVWAVSKVLLCQQNLPEFNHTRMSAWSVMGVSNCCMSWVTGHGLQVAGKMLQVQEIVTGSENCHRSKNRTLVIKIEPFLILF